MFIVLWLLVITEQWAAWRRPSPRRLALATVLLGASVLAHPFGMLTAAASGAAWLGVLVWSPAARELPGGRVRWWLVMHAGGFAIAAGWLALFFGAAESMRRGPVPWESLAELTASVLRGDLFDARWMWAGPFAVVGAVLLVRRAGAVGWVVLAAGAMMLVLASTDAIALLRLDLLVSGFKNLQFPRWAFAIKPLSYTLGAVGLVATVRALAAWSSPRAQRVTMGGRFAAALLAAPLLASLGAEPSRLIPRPIGAVDTLADADLADADLGLLRALRAEQRLADGEEIRVAFLRSGMTGAMWPLLTLAEARVPIVLDGHVATINFRHRVTHRRPTLLSALGVTHVLWDGTLAHDEELAKEIDLVGEWGHMRLARLRTPPHRSPVELGADGIVEIEHATTEELRFSLTGISPQTRFALRPAPHAKWQLEYEGEPLEVEPWGGGYMRMRALGPDDGQYVLRYVDSPRQRRAYWLSLVVALACLGGLAFGRPVKVTRRDVPEGLRRIATGVGAVAVVAGLLWVSRHQDEQLAETWNEVGAQGRGRRTARSYVRDLVVDDAIAVERTPSEACRGVMTKDALDDCVEVDHAPRRALLYDEPYLYRCLQVSVPPRGELRFSFPGVGPTQTVIGTLQNSGRPGTSIAFSFSAGPRALGRHPQRIELAGDKLADGLDLVITNDASRPERICLAAAVFEPG